MPQKPWYLFYSVEMKICDELLSRKKKSRGKCERRAMTVIRIPSAVFVCMATLFFLLYLLPWHSLPSVQSKPSPSTGPKDQSSLSRISSSFSSPIASKQIASELDPTIPGLVSYRAILNSNIQFNVSRSDVLVILHIQKTGGTSFEKHIVQDLVLEKPCICWKRRKRCKCPRPSSSQDVVKSGSKTDNSEPWLFSRFSTGWICGLHADWTELSACVDAELDKAHGSVNKRRYFYASMIRDPIHRFLSEFRHVQRGATWKASRHICNGHYATSEELGSCYSGRSWTDVSLREFIECPHNLAFNRQTRMLADLSLVGCYNKSYMPVEEKNRIILSSAKRNLESMAFVGVTEFQRMSQYVFEETFKLRFKIPFTQNEDTYSKDTLDKATQEELEDVRRVNNLDIELYDFARQLLHNRFEELKQLDADFEDHYNFLGEEKGRHFSWDEVENEE